MHNFSILVAVSCYLDAHTDRVYREVRSRSDTAKFKGRSLGGVQGVKELVHRYVRPAPALTMRRCTRKNKARRLTTALAAWMLLFTSLLLMFRVGR